MKLGKVVGGWKRGSDQ